MESLPHPCSSLYDSVAAFLKGGHFLTKFEISIKSYYHYTNFIFVRPSVSPGGHGKPFDPS